MVSFRVNSFRDSFSVVLRAQHYYMLTVRRRNYSLIFFSTLSCTCEVHPADLSGNMVSVELIQ